MTIYQEECLNNSLTKTTFIHKIAEENWQWLKFVNLAQKVSGRDKTDVSTKANGNA
jgi:hypothetical protein